MRLGIDFGGTKIEIIALDDAGIELFRKRIDTPREDYHECLQALKTLIAAAEEETKLVGTVGIGIPGSLSPKTGLVKNANSTWMNGKPLDLDLAKIIGRPVRIQNDANCLAVSEATDGAAKGCRIVHAIIIGTGCGSGIAIDGKAHLGANGIGGEWGAISVPWLKQDEFPGPESWIGHRGVIDRWCSGTGFQLDYQEKTGELISGQQIISRMRDGNKTAELVYQAYVSRLARAIAMAANFLDPDVFVLGGGMSNIDELYRDIPIAMRPFVFSDFFETPVRKAKHGDSSGVRGAAWLW